MPLDTLRGCSCLPSVVVLQKAREANQDLQIQLDQLLQQAQDPNSKGNSLFSEVCICVNGPQKLKSAFMYADYGTDVSGLG